MALFSKGLILPIVKRSGKKQQNKITFKKKHRKKEKDFLLHQSKLLVEVLYLETR